jgi:hypothetical protein
MPVQYHDAIVWRACMMLAEHDEAPIRVRQSGAQINAAILLNMAATFCRAIEVGGNALA